MALVACGSGLDPELVATAEEATSSKVTLVVGEEGVADDLGQQATGEAATGEALVVGDVGDETSTVHGEGAENTDAGAEEESGSDADADAGSDADADTGAAPEAETASGAGEGAKAVSKTPSAGSAGSGVPLVIYDTDMGPDIDDALALAMLHSYQKLGKIELAAVTVSRNSVDGARFTDALNTFYGRPDIPIGINRNNPPYYDDRVFYPALANKWPNDVAQKPIEDGYKLQRRVLAEARGSGRSVLLIQTGFSGNVSQLLDSPGDGISPMSGSELVRETVPLFSIMAGSIGLGIAEFNIEKEIGPARNVFAKWPGPLAMSPFELGNSITYPYWAIRDKLTWVSRHPVREAYEFNDLGWHVDAPPFYNMRSWDLTSVIEAVEPGADYFLTSTTGKVQVDPTGRTSFQPGQGQHYVLDRANQYTAQQRQRVVDRMIELVSMRP